MKRLAQRGAHPSLSQYRFSERSEKGKEGIKDMTKQEFLDRVQAVFESEGIKGVKAGISDNDYRSVEFVYTWHPAISEVNGKEQIAKIYVDFGMSVISDMVSRSHIMREKETELMRLQSSINELKGDIEDLKKGVSLDMFQKD